MKQIKFLSQWRRLAIALCMASISTLTLFAQGVNVSGTVTDEKGNSMPGVNVTVSGTTNGVVTDATGNYSITVPDEASVLVFSFVGYTTKEVTVGSQRTISPQMEEGQQLEEVVVTALGISREKKSLGYAVQEVSGDELSNTRETNFVNSLSGKIAGVSITGASGNMGGSSRILIRGANSVSGENQPMFVIDGVPISNDNYNTYTTQRGAGGYDYGNMASDLNALDIESVSVLKGPTASALYGSRAANGVIVITTKKGTAGKGFGVSINTGITFEQIAILPKYQNEYGGGYGNDFMKVTIDGKEYNVVDYSVDESWGPKFDPNVMVLNWNAFDEWDKENYMKPKPWVAPAHDVRDFFKTGVTYTNNISVSGGSDKTTYRLSYTNMSLNGFMPNSSMRKNTVSINADSKINKYVEAFSTVTYYNNYAKGRVETGYGDNSIMQRFNQWGQRQLDMEELKAYKNPDGSQRTWNRSSWDDPTPAYSNNPYWSLYEDYSDDTKNRVFGTAGLRFNIAPGLQFVTKFNGDFFSFMSRERVAIGSCFESRYSENSVQRGEYNLEGRLSYSKVFDKISLDAMVGANQMQRYLSECLTTTMGGLVIPGLFTLTNAASTVSDPNKSHRMINSIFGNATIGYASTVYFDFTLRNDWSSTLPKGNNSYLYPSFNLSYIFTESLPDLPWLSYGKVRGGWSQVANDTSPYRLLNYYEAAQIIYGSWTNMTYDGSPIYALPARLNNADLKPEMTASWELGTELRFFNNRIGLDVTYYNMRSKNQIISLPISSTTGYTNRVINAGMITNRGVEVMLTTTPVKTKDLEWNVNFNFAANRNNVEELAPGVTNLELGVAPFNATVNATLGKPYGTIRATDFVYDDKGNKLIDSDGRYLTSSTTDLASVMPDWTGGISTSLKYKNLDFGALLDIRQGGVFFSTTNMWGMYSGILAATTANGLRDNGIVLDGMMIAYDSDGNPVEDANGNYVADKKNDKVLDGQVYCEDFYTGPQRQNLLDASYVKLREVTLGYTLPKSWLGPAVGIRVSVFGRNLYTWGKCTDIVDPENTTSSSNVQGLEGGALPSVRTFGFNINVNF